MSASFPLQLSITDRPSRRQAGPPCLQVVSGTAQAACRTHPPDDAWALGIRHGASEARQASIPSRWVNPRSFDRYAWEWVKGEVPPAEGKAMSLGCMKKGRASPFRQG